MKKVTEQDIYLINNALEAGFDVRIQNTSNNGYRIVADRVKVLKRSGDGKSPSGTDLFKIEKE